ncbi:four helix bundle protein [Mangrovimonas sp. DI 80]|uniref:four helix bundle protein n=1 Tax=Mangrovimonas sp. DI 80 TaxID=1779330 RepID=UPI000975A623|nr:four helix bundle protein [Mangrovimonas sp. DI 80]OMP31875.1 four helix bundle protein [Mangrovimonas sp. DI 80]
MKPNPIKEKSFDFAVGIVNLYQELTTEKKEFVMSRQLLKSATSIGANVREAEFAQSKADFTNKMSISLKEANETDYWLDLLHATNYLDSKEFDKFKLKSQELLRLLVSIVKSSKL